VYLICDVLLLKQDVRLVDLALSEFLLDLLFLAVGSSYCDISCKGIDSVIQNVRLC
jgi:hypothetical protein